MGRFGACRTYYDLCKNPRSHEKSCERVASGAKGPDSPGNPNPHESVPGQGYSPVVGVVAQQRAEEEAMETAPPPLDWGIDKIASALDRVDAAKVSVLSFT